MHGLWLARPRIFRRKRRSVPFHSLHTSLGGTVVGPNISSVSARINARLTCVVESRKIRSPRMRSVRSIVLTFGAGFKSGGM